MHIFLIGFMGSGKSTIGRRLSHVVNLDFVDLDAIIESKLKMSIAEIFDAHDEDYFRKIEHECLIDVVSSSSSKVIALGGGTPCYYNNIDIVKVNGVSIYLKVGIDKLVKRLKVDDNRPLLQNYLNNDRLLRKQVKNLLKERSHVYEQADYTIMAYRDIDSIIKRIAVILNK